MFVALVIIRYIGGSLCAYSPAGVDDRRADRHLRGVRERGTYLAGFLALAVLTNTPAFALLAGVLLALVDAEAASATLGTHGSPLSVRTNALALAVLALRLETTVHAHRRTLA